MTHLAIDESKFSFDYLHDYARYLLEQKLTEFGTVFIRFCKEAGVPLMEPLKHLPEEKLLQVNRESNVRMLTALGQGRIVELIRDNCDRWMNDKLQLVKKADVKAEDITLINFVKRKTFTYFLDAYTKNTYLQKLIIGEVDVYTSYEELVSFQIYVEMQKEKLKEANEYLHFYKDLLLAGEHLSETGCFSINFEDRSKTVYTPQYLRVFNITEEIKYPDFLTHVHPEDKEQVMKTLGDAMSRGGTYQLDYRYEVNGTYKRIWSRGIASVKDGQCSLIKGVVKEYNPRLDSSADSLSLNA